MFESRAPRQVLQNNTAGLSGGFAGGFLLGVQSSKTQQKDPEDLLTSGKLT